ncbi:hypothetical protein L208DRAFT_1526273, partial [Tricholoma matsutake]
MRCEDVNPWLNEVAIADNRLLALHISGIQVPRGTYTGLQQNAATLKDFAHLVPKPIVIVVQINGHPAQELLDSGLLGDFMSTALADQLKVKKVELQKPLLLQLAVQGSHSKVNWGTTVNFKYQSINKEQHFDIANLSSYDIILGTPWLYVHCMTMGINPARMIVGSNKALPLKGDAVTKISSRAMEVAEEDLQWARDELIEYAHPLCKEMVETGLPPLRAINHEIPLIDIGKVYPWRPSRCPKMFQPQWTVKKNAYLASGHWKVTSARNMVPMLLIPKPGA